MKTASILALPAQAEKVLGVPLAAFAPWAFQHDVPHRGVSRVDRAALAELFTRPSSTFRPRSEVESDPSFIQAVAYVVVRDDDGVLVYKRGRSGGEGRLHDLLSIGLGGHVNPRDAATSPDPVDAVEWAACRELAEESGLVARSNQMELLGVVRDDSNAVGAVHLGILFLATLPPRPAPIWSSEINDPQFVAPALIPPTWPMESWSRLVLDSDALAGL